MKNLLRNSSVIFFLLFTFASLQIFADNSALAKTRVIDGVVTSTWGGTNSITTQPTIETITGSIASNVGTWTRTRLTYHRYVCPDRAYHSFNGNGDIVVVFEYFDPNTFISTCAAGMLPSGTTTWSVYYLVRW